MVRESRVEDRKSSLRGTRILAAGVALLTAFAVVACSDDDDTSNGTPGDLNEADSGTSTTPPKGTTDSGKPGTSEPDAAGDDAGNDAGHADDGAVVDPTSCVVQPTAIQGDTFVELCKPTQGGTIKHVTIAGLTTPATHASAQVVFGFDAAPSSAQAALEADQFRVLFYGGGAPAPPAIIQASFGSVDQALEGDATFLNTGSSTVCFDVHDGSVDVAPYFALWATGQKGADCADPSTLTVASARSIRVNWKGAKGTVDKAAKAFYRQAAGLAAPTITVSTTAALSADALKAAVDCTSDWTANTDWQKLCAPTAGTARHVRIEGVRSTANNSYWYAVLGQEPNPTGNPAIGAGKLIVTGGQAHDGASWTWFRFGNVTNSNSTTQFKYATDASEALYTATASTVCFDLGQSGTNQRFVYWATGAKGANCTDRTTLTTTSALYDSTTDAASGAIWAGLLDTTKESFIKTSNASTTLVRALVSSEPAAL